MPAGVDMIPKLSPHAGIQKPCHANTWLNLHSAEMAPYLGFWNATLDLLAATLGWGCTAAPFEWAAHVAFRGLTGVAFHALLPEPEQKAGDGAQARAASDPLGCCPAMCGCAARVLAVCAAPVLAH